MDQVTWGRVVASVVRLGVALALVVVVVGGRTAEASRSTGELQVVSIARGATVEVDGKPVGRIPLAGRLVLTVGEHEVRVSKLGYRDVVARAVIRAGRVTELELDPVPFAGILNVVSKVAGAEVSVAGKVVGRTPVRAAVPLAGRHEMVVRLAGYRDFRTEVVLRLGAETSVDVVMVVLPATVKDADPPEPSIVEKWWFWTLIAVAVAGVAVTVALVVQEPETETRTVPPRSNTELVYP